MIIIYILITIIILTICLIFYLINDLNNHIEQINYFIIQFIKENKKVYPTQEQLDKFIESIYN